MPDTAPVDFHLVIPAFEESVRLPVYLADLRDALRDAPYVSRILIVDDGSSEADRAQLRGLVSSMALAGGPAVDLQLLDRNRGKGYAVRHGWRAGAGATWLAFADADGATPANEVARVLALVHRTCDVRRCYFGARIRMLGRSVDRKWKRHIIGRLYATLVGAVINDAIYDSQCGFKIVPAAGFAAVADRLVEDRFAFDSELIAALAAAGYGLEEVPIDWRDVPGSKVSFFRDSVRMVTSLLMIRRRIKSGAYRADGSR